MNISRCRKCDAEIYWIRTKGGRRMPVDAEPVRIKQDYHGWPYFQLDGTEIFGTKAGDADDDPDTNFIEAYESHFATCPNADDFRRKPRKPRSRGRQR